MARSRNIKPGFFQNDLLAEIEPLGRLLFAGLWTIADRAGRLQDRYKRIEASILPYDECDVNKLLSELAERGFITRYSVNEETFIQIVNFTKHQNPHCKEPESTIPSPDNNCINFSQALDINDARIGQAPNENRSSPADSLNLIPDSLDLFTDNPSFLPTVSNNIEEGAKKIKLTADGLWVGHERHLAIWRNAYKSIDVDAELSKAAAWCICNPLKKPRSDFARFLNNWLKNAKPTPERSVGEGNVL